MSSSSGPIQIAALPAPGAIVGGKYRLERYIAEGGMGSIAVARHLELDEAVAIKFLKPAVIADDPTGEVAGRFLREARATIKIRSEHVPRILDVAMLDGGLPYIVMELLVGEDLDRRVDTRGGLPVAQAVDFVLQALEALAAAHVLGIVHRDFKPANLFLSHRLDGTECVKVLDFGIAKLVDQNASDVDQGLTNTRAVIGSPRYMAPEQMRSSKDVDSRADIWAVGTTLYELVTGAPPFNGESLTAVCASILQDEPPPMQARRREVPPGLDAVVRRCLAKRVDDRWLDVADLANALAPFGGPAAAEMAARITRVRRAAPQASISTRAIAPPESVPQLAVSGAGMTQTSWGGSDGDTSARRWRLWSVAALLGSLFVLGSVLGGVALLRGRRPPPAGVVATPATETPPPPATTAPPEAPATTAPPEAPATTAPPEAPATTAPPEAPAASDTATAAAETAAKPRPKPPEATKPAAKPTSSAKTPSQGLWDDRK